MDGPLTKKPDPSKSKPLYGSAAGQPPPPRLCHSAKTQVRPPQQPSSSTHGLQRPYRPRGARGRGLPRGNVRGPKHSHSHMLSMSRGSAPMPRGNLPLPPRMPRGNVLRGSMPMPRGSMPLARGTVSRGVSQPSRLMSRGGGFSPRGGVGFNKPRQAGPSQMHPRGPSPVVRSRATPSQHLDMGDSPKAKLSTTQGLANFSKPAANDQWSILDSLTLLSTNSLDR